MDSDRNVWVTGHGSVVLKFTRNGRLLLTIGKFDQTGGSNSRTLLGNPTDMYVDTKANEVYVADGYLNRRVVVFDSETGAYKRHWGAYGNVPDDGPPELYLPAGRFRSSSSSFTASTSRTTGSCTCATVSGTASRSSRRAARS